MPCKEPAGGEDELTRRASLLWSVSSGPHRPQQSVQLGRALRVAMGLPPAHHRPPLQLRSQAEARGT